MEKIIKNIVVLSVLAGIFLFSGSQNSRAAGTFSSLAPPLDKLRYQTGQADYSHQSLFNVPIQFPLRSLRLCGDKKVGEITESHSHAWGENVGWVNFRPEGVKLEIGGNILTGWIEIKTLGWVYVGDGKPENGLRYSNSYGRDYGVNNDKKGNLSGYAWSENVGWINFDKVNICKEGNFSGYAFSKNIGRIKFNSGGSVEYMVKTDPYPWKEIGVREEIKAANGSFPGNESDGISICTGSREFTIPPTSISLDLYLDEAGKTIEDEIVLGFETAENKIDLRIDEETRKARGPPEREKLNIISKQFVVQSFGASDQAVLKGCTAFNLFMDI